MRLQYFLVLAITAHSLTATADLTIMTEPRCGHWAVLRMCQLNGVPANLRGIVNRMPIEQEANNFAQLRDVLGGLGLDCQGYKETYETFVSEPFPCIAHFSSGHFVVIESASISRVFYYSDGRAKQAMPQDEFVRQWSGKVLRLDRKAIHSKSSRWTKKPAVRFDTLLIDKGTVSQNIKRVEYTFPFHNIGSAELDIEGVKTSCSCLESVITKSNIKHGESSAIILKYRVDSSAPEFSHRAIVKSNDPDHPIVELVAQGSLDSSFTATPRALELGDMEEGRVYTKYISVTCSDQYLPLSVRIVKRTTFDLGVTCRIFTREQIREYLDELKTTTIMLPYQAIIVVTFKPKYVVDGDNAIAGSVVISSQTSDGKEIEIPFGGKVCK